MNIFFSGIGGVAIGPLCEIALDAGYQVQGSDRHPSLITDRLERRGIPISVGEQDGTYLRERHQLHPIDWLIYTSALPGNHPELQLAKELGIKTAKRDELIAHIIKEKRLELIAVAGTHGKTTTTGMFVWALKKLGVPVSYSVGTTLSWGPSGVYDSTSKYFVYECDEFDRNFLHFFPHLSVITSIDYDHPETYPTEEDYKSAFRQFIQQSERTIMWRQDAKYLDSSHPETWYLQETETLNVPIAGAHNRNNATLVLKGLERLGFGAVETNCDLIATFPGTDRRFERLADNLYSDYGHHPAEIMATLQMARELSDHVVLAYQPHQNVRQHHIQHEYENAFLAAEHIYWLPTYLSREDPNLEILSPEALTSGITNRDIIEITDLNDELWSKLTAARSNGKLVLLMGAGTIDAWARKKLKD